MEAAGRPPQVRSALQDRLGQAANGAGGHQERLPPPLFARMQAGGRQRGPDRFDIRCRTHDRTAPSQAQSGVIRDGARPGGPDAVVPERGTRRQAEGHEGAGRPCSGDGPTRTSQDDDIAIAPAIPPAQLVSQGDGADRVESAQAQQPVALVRTDDIQALAEEAHNDDGAGWRNPVMRQALVTTLGDVPAKAASPSSERI